jgi:heme/copper-type cytochrome/quinol oxidase subunit 2
MTIGTSIFVIALGAILRYAVNDSIESIDLEIVGLILMIAGAVGLVIGLFWMVMASNRDDDYRQPPPPR